MQHRYTRYINRRCTNCSLMSSASTCVDCTANHWLGSLPSISAKYFPIAQLKCPYEIEVQSAYQLQRVLNELVNIYGMKPKRRIGSIYKTRAKLDHNSSINGRSLGGVGPLHAVSYARRSVSTSLSAFILSACTCPISTRTAARSFGATDPSSSSPFPSP